VTEDEVVREIVARAWRFGVAVILAPSDLVDYGDGLQSSGYFSDHGQPTLAVAWKHERHLGTLLHEYCHLTQWIENATVWRDDKDADLDTWLSGKPVRNIRKKLAATRELEADCERRTIRLARELEAPLDLADYARGANGYIHFYNVIADVRKWYRPDRRPYQVPEVLALCNPTIDDDFTRTPSALRAALLTCI